MNLELKAWAGDMNWELIRIEKVFKAIGVNGIPEQRMQRERRAWIWARKVQCFQTGLRRTSKEDQGRAFFGMLHISFLDDAVSVVTYRRPVWELKIMKPRPHLDVMKVLYIPIFLSIK